MSTTYARLADSFRCDECGKDMAFPLFCDHCGTDYPERQRMSPFGLLGLEADFDLAEDDLDGRELLLAQRLHPDRWQARGERLHRKALLAQSAVNEALEAVREPFARAVVLLDLLAEGADVPRTKLPTPFLVEQLELQEEIEDGVDNARKREMTKEARGALEALRQQLSEGFTAASDPATGEQLAALREAIDRSHYWRNVQRALRGRAPGA